MPIALEARSVTAGYGAMKAIFDVSLRVPEGSLVAMLGPNGAGKTTTLRAMAGVIGVDAGQICLHGRPVTKASMRARVRDGMCLIPEGRGIFPNLTVRENLLMQSGKRKFSRAALAPVFARFPRLYERLDQIAGSMSGGEQQMLALSRALVRDPRVLLLDEISMGLAPLVVESLFEVVRQLAHDGVTIVLVEQLIEDSLEIADYVVLMNQGHLVTVGQPADVADRLTASYLGDVPAPRSVAARPDEPKAGYWRTPKGSMRHLADCPIVVDRDDLAPAETRELSGCGMCTGQVADLREGELA
jgi:branched-chain amino acid transport system ATP-binding protein